MQWHFGPETGSPFWLERARTLPFGPRTDVKTHDDLMLFPNVAAQVRDVPAQDLIPRGYGRSPDVVGVFESGGTTGAPKRVVLLRDWLERMLHWSNLNLDAHGFARGLDWLGLVPTGPHIVGEYFRRSATTHGRHGFTLDLDPRWVKKLIASRRGADADTYAEHLVDHAAFILRTQDIGVLTITPPLLERVARRDDLTELVNEKVRAIRWGGTQLDPDSRYLYKTEVFPGTVLCGNYGSTMILGVAGERPGLPDDAGCVFDPYSPYVTFSVVDPETLRPVGYGDRGRVMTREVDWREHLDTIVDSVSGHGGTGCVNTTAVFVEGDPAPLCAALAERLAAVPSLPPQDPAAVFPVQPLATAKALEAHLLHRATGTRPWLGGDGVLAELGDGSAVLRGAVHQLDSPHEPQAAVEMPFPCVWVGPWTRADGLAPLKGTLVLTAITHDDGLVAELVAEPSIGNVYVGDHRTYWMDSGLPHDGYLAEFLMRCKSVIRD
ncbi:hypothetical protein ACFXDH_23105 [Streptomyces sp. NPDC059467]|uniref:hypothetical protein n=1 Tax=Streptomyces sp. NPDC059467 TaxID=3346844 RepID=UPI0036B534FF